MKQIIPLLTDQYKLNCHFKVLPEDTEKVYSYMEARNGAKYEGIHMVLLQYYIKEYLLPVVTMEDIDFAEQVALATNTHDKPFNREGWEYIVNNHGGKLPIVIKAPPEGTFIPTGNVILTIENTDEKCAWLTNYVETLLMKLWYPMTLAFRSKANMEVIKDSFITTSDLDPEIARHLYVDFGYRGATCEEQAAIGGASHLLSNFGSDTIAGTLLLAEYYNGGNLNGISEGVPASEHSIGTSRGEDGELDYYRDMLVKFPNGIVSIVADSYNIVRFVAEYTKTLKQEILDRFENGTAPLNRVVIRPDSLRNIDDTPSKQVIWIHEMLGDIFGCSENSKGYKVLHPAVGVLWGDGIDDTEIRGLYKDLADAGWSTESLVIGQGGGLINAGDNNTRDTNRFAIKCSAQQKNGEWVDIQKNPLDQSKKSKAGRLCLMRDGSTNSLQTMKLDDVPSNAEELNLTNILDVVFEDGVLVKEYTLDEVRAIMKQQ